MKVSTLQHRIYYFFRHLDLHSFLAISLAFFFVQFAQLMGGSPLDRLQLYLFTVTTVAVLIAVNRTWRVWGRISQTTLAPYDWYNFKYTLGMSGALLVLNLYVTWRHALARSIWHAEDSLIQLALTAPSLTTAAEAQGLTPLFLYVLRAVFQLFGFSEWSAHLPSFLFAVLSPVFLFLMTAEYVRKRVAFIACVLFSLNPIILWSSAEIAPTSFCVFLIILALGMMLNSLKTSSSWESWATLAIMSFYVSLSASTGPTLTLVIFLITLPLVPGHLFKSLILRLFFAWGTGIALSLPFTSGWRGLFNNAVLDLQFSTFYNGLWQVLAALGDGLSPSTFSYLFMTAVALGLLSLLRRRTLFQSLGPEALSLLFFCIVFPVISILFRYDSLKVSTVLPFYFLTFAILSHVVWEHTSFFIRYIRIIMRALLLLAVALPLYEGYKDSALTFRNRPGGTAWRDFTDWIEKSGSSGSRAYIISLTSLRKPVPCGIPAPSLYYFGKIESKMRMPTQPGLCTDQLFELREDLNKDEQPAEVYLLIPTLSSSWRPSDVILTESLEAEVFTFQNLDVIRIPNRSRLSLTLTALFENMMVQVGTAEAKEPLIESLFFLYLKEKNCIYALDQYRRLQSLEFPGQTRTQLRAAFAASCADLESQTDESVQ